MRGSVHLPGLTAVSAMESGADGFPVGLSIDLEQIAGGTLRWNGHKRRKAFALLWQYCTAGYGIQLLTLSGAWFGAFDSKIPSIYCALAYRISLHGSVYKSRLPARKLGHVTLLASIRSSRIVLAIYIRKSRVIYPNGYVYLYHASQASQPTSKLARIVTYPTPAADRGDGMQ